MRLAAALLCVVFAVVVSRQVFAADAPQAHHPATQPTTEISPGVYSSDKFGFSVTTPVDWHRQQTQETAPLVLVVAAADTPEGTAATTLRIEYRPKFRGKIDTIVSGMETAAAAGDPKAQLSPIGGGVLGGSPAKRFTVLKSVKGISTRIMYLVTFRNGHLYTFSIQNDGKHDPVKDTIETSFKFTN